MIGAPQLLNALIPDHHNQRFYTPPTSYNQYAYGTGSQAMYQDGGILTNGIPVDLNTNQNNNWSVPFSTPVVEKKSNSYEGSFSKAFKQARKDLGAGKIFTWNGRQYSTDYASDQSKSSSNTSKKASKKTTLNEITDWLNNSPQVYGNPGYKRASSTNNSGFPILPINPDIDPNYQAPTIQQGSWTGDGTPKDPNAFVNRYRGAVSPDLGNQNAQELWNGTSDVRNAALIGIAAGLLSPSVQYFPAPAALEAGASEATPLLGQGANPSGWISNTLGAFNFANGGNINIKESHRGKFTKWAKDHGMTVKQAAKHVMAHKEDYSHEVIAMANFAKNFDGKAELGATFEFKNGGEVSAKKAKEILKDGTANGKKLTPAQKRYFGWIAGGKKAEDGAVVTNYGYSDPIPGMTQAQIDALSGFIPYNSNASEVQHVESTQYPIVQPNTYGYYTPNPDGTFGVNIDRYLQDRTAASGRVGDAYSFVTNRAYAYEGKYGNKDYTPTIFSPTGYNRPFENGGTMNYKKNEIYDLSPQEIAHLRSQGYDIEII